MSEGLILLCNLGRLVEPPQADGGDAEPLLEREGGAHRLVAEDEIEVGCRERCEFLVRLAARELRGPVDARLSEQGEELRVSCDRREEAEQVGLTGPLLARLQQAVDRLAHGLHRRALALARQRVHVAGAHGDACGRFGLAADALHIGAEQCVGTCQADHDDGGALPAAGDERADGLGNALQMAARDDVCLIEREVGEALAVMAAARERRRIAAATAGRDEQHDAAGHAEPRALDAEALRARRVEVDGRWRVADEMRVRAQFGRDAAGTIFLDAAGEFLHGDRIGIS